MKKNNFINQISRKLIIRQLSKINYGQLIINEDNSTLKFGKKKSIKAVININNLDFYTSILLGGSIGSAESYIRNDWETRNLTNVIRIMALNSSTMDSMELTFKLFLRPFLKIIHYLNRNTLAGSKQNIIQHYDLSNKFFSLFLDPTMMYSSAIYKNSNTSLNEASIYKLKMICEKLQLKKTDKVIEIGSGWGGFAIYAAQNYGCNVTTTTISDQQYKYVKNKIEKLGLSKKVTLLKKDYRDLKGKYNKLVSIEMIEAVGHEFYDAYFNKISNLLTKDGDALIQAITIRDQRFDQALKSVDFIQKYIFPGSCIPSLYIIQKSLKNVTDMTIFNIEDIGFDYSKTLKDWRKKFLKNKKEIIKLGFTEEFYKTWLFYLCYCEGGFYEKVISDVHLHITKPYFRK